MRIRVTNLLVRGTIIGLGALIALHLHHRDPGPLAYEDRAMQNATVTLERLPWQHDH